MHLSLWQILVLAVVQGIAEFLPISSDGHLTIVAPLLFGGSEPPEGLLTVSIALHVGTLGSILLYYHRRIVRLLTTDRRTIGLIAVGTIPAVIVGLTIKLTAERLLESPLLAGMMLPVTGGLLLWSVRRPLGTTEYNQLRWRDSLWIGIAQAAAILPGVSRSGSTIAAGLGVGLARPSAVSYSFLLAIPALAGAGLLEGLSIYAKGPPAVPLAWLAIGGGVSLVVGLAALWSLERVLARGWLPWFGWYCIVLGLVVTAWQVVSLAQGRA
jgi:undecaprenyl-diphosphatase